MSSIPSQLKQISVANQKVAVSSNFFHRTFIFLTSRDEKLVLIKERQTPLNWRHLQFRMRGLLIPPTLCIESRVGHRTLKATDS